MKNFTLRAIYIDPSYSAFYEDKLFDLTNPVLNRDDQLLPLARLREFSVTKGIDLYTADRLQAGSVEEGGEYYSLGLISEQARLNDLKITSRGYILMEPPVVAPELYSTLAEISERFERVYLHNTHGGGYSLSGVNVGRLRKLYWPLPYRGVLENYWQNQKRSRKIVAINGHHKPVNHLNELYSKRIEALAVLSKTDSADLYGNGWNDWFSRRGFWLPYLLNRRAIANIYRGPCRSKYEVLSQYSFCLCFENMKMDGYVTEKIFDCLYAGTIPLYLGANDISSYVPAEAFIDCRQFTNWEELRDCVSSLSQFEIDATRSAGKAFMQSEKILPFFNSFENMVFNH